MTREYKGDVYKFGGRLRAWREQAGLTQVGLAQQLGVKQQTVSDWERGSTLPHHSRAGDLERALGLAPQTVLHAIHGETTGNEPVLRTSGGESDSTDYDSRIANMPPHVKRIIDDIIEREEERRGP